MAAEVRHVFLITFWGKLTRTRDEKSAEFSSQMMAKGGGGTGDKESWQLNFAAWRLETTGRPHQRLAEVLSDKTSEI